MSPLYLATTALLAALFGAVVALGLVPLARLMGRLSVPKALLVGTCLAFAVPLLTCAGTTAFLGPFVSNHPTAMGPGAGTAAVLVPFVLMLAGVILALLLFLARWSERAMRWTVILGASLGWTIGGREAFSLAQWRLSPVLGSWVGDSRAYSTADQVLAGVVALGVGLLTEFLLAKAVLRPPARPEDRKRRMATAAAVLVCIAAVWGWSVVRQRSEGRRIRANDERVAREVEAALVANLAGLNDEDDIVRRHGRFVRLTGFDWARDLRDIHASAVAEFRGSRARIDLSILNGPSTEIELKIEPPESLFEPEERQPGGWRSMKTLKLIDGELWAVEVGRPEVQPELCRIIASARYPDLIAE